MVCLETNIVVIWIVNGRSSSLRRRLGEQMRCRPASAPLARLTAEKPVQPTKRAQAKARAGKAS